ncbi:MAG: histidine kinase [Lachnoclostridium sp.]
MNLIHSSVRSIRIYYNTLDTIYMLARINKEEKTMKIIQALSKYLRLSLSKGNDIVTVEDEVGKRKKLYGDSGNTE